MSSRFGGSTFKTRLRIFDLPNYGRTEADGVLGWRTLARNIFFIDAGRNDVFALKELPEKVKSWQQFRLQQDAKYLTLIISDNGNTNIVVIDTGSESGINLAPEKWRAWKAAHPKQRLTLTGSYMPAAGVFVEEQAWAENISLGSLCFTNVAISEAHPTQIDSPTFLAVLGMAALKQLPIVVDGKNATAYVNYRKQPLTRYEHNRLGAAFVPVGLPKDDKLVAFVTSDSPAQKAGIQNGDVLLKIGNLDVTKWQTDSTISVNKSWEQPQGTELRLALKRGQQTNEVTVKLENILGPDKP